MNVQENKKLCKFQNVGYCKYSDKCRFRHVSVTCKDAKCLGKGCDKRHPKRCKFHFLKKNCKFAETCCYSHSYSDNKNNELLEKLKVDLENMKQKNKELEAINVELDKANKALKKDVDEKSKFIEQSKIQQKEHETRLDTIEDVNEKLIGDIKTLIT